MPLLETLPVLPTVRQWQILDTSARVVVTDPAFADRAAELVSEQVQEIDQVCGRDRADSELNRIHQAVAGNPTDRPVTVSALLAVLIGAALEAASRTDGDLDPTLTDDLSALGYPEDFTVLQARAGGYTVPITLTRRVRHSWRDVSLTGRRLRLPAGLRLDLDITARAWAADRAARSIHARFGVGVLVVLGAHVATAGPAPAEGWQFVVQDGAQEPAAPVGLDAGTAGLATASTVSRGWRFGTRAVQHVLDPGEPLPTAPLWRTVSVAADTCLDAGRVATAAILRGPDAPNWLRAQGYPARLVSATGEVLTVSGWPGEQPELPVDAEPVHELTLTRLPRPDLLPYAA